MSNPFINPNSEFTDTEQNIVIEKLSDPAVMKYLNIMLANSAWSIAMAAPKTGEDIGEFLRNRSAAQGQVMVIMTLLNIAETFNKPASANPANQTE